MPTIVTKTVKPAGGGDYSSINAWDLAERKNLVTADEISRAECYSGGNLISANFSLSAATWVTDATRYIDIVAAAGNRHLGVFTTGKAYIQGVSANTVPLTITNKYTRLRQMQVQQLAANQANGAIQHNGTLADLIIDQCIVRYSVLAAVGSAAAIYFGGSGAGTVTSTVKGSFIFHYGGATNGHVYGIWVTQQTVFCYSTTLINLNVLGGGKTSGGVTTDNAASTITTDDCYMHGTSNYLKMGAVGTINKGTSDSTSNTDAVTVGLRNIAYSTTNFLDITSQAEDLHIKNTSVLKWAGVAVAGVTNDIDGDLFHNPPSIGGDELAVVAATKFDNALLKSGDWNTKQYAASLMHKSKSSNVSGSVSNSLNPQDTASAKTKYATRFGRSFRKIPSKNYWDWASQSLDTTISQLSRENGLRWYEEIMKNSQVVSVDGPCLIAGTLIPHSFVHPDEPSVADTLTWASAMNANSFSMEFVWMSTFAPWAVQSDIELARISLDVNNYIRLKILALTSTYQRTYKQDAAYGYDQPTLRLEKIRAGAPDGSVDVQCYFGSTQEDGVGERIDDPILFRISNLARDRMSLEVLKFGYRGYKETPAATAFTLQEASLIFNGIGYYSEPKLVDVRAGRPGRVLPSGRVGIRGRTIDVSSSDTWKVHIDAVLSGERDPTLGQMQNAIPYSEATSIPGMPASVDNFTRANDADLGANWNIIRQTGAGFNIISNKADCAQEGIEYFIGAPNHQDINVVATVVVNNTNDIVGVFNRHNPIYSDVTAYGAEIIQTGASAATLRFVRWWLGTKYILATDTLSSYTSGTSYKLLLQSVGDDEWTSIVRDLADVELANIFHVEAFLPRPAFYGIYGQTGGAGQHVQITDLKVAASYQKTLR